MNGVIEMQNGRAENAEFVEHSKCGEHDDGVPVNVKENGVLCLTKLEREHWDVQVAGVVVDLTVD